MTRHVSKVWLTNDKSSTLIIPIEIARKHGIDKPCYVKIEDKGDHILVKKMEI